MEDDFDLQTQVQSSIFGYFERPARSRGFVIVVTCIAIHLLMVAIIAIEVIQRSKYPFLGEKWQALAQLSRGETESILQTLGDKTDGEVRKELKLKGLKRRLVWIAKDSDTGNIAVMERAGK
jgi:hypothetical protein